MNSLDYRDMRETCSHTIISALFKRDVKFAESMESSCWLSNRRDTKQPTLECTYPIISKVDHEIRDAEESPRFLLEKRRNLFSERNCRLDPILRFPPEIASYIFECCLPIRDETFFVCLDRHHDRRMPWLLRSICRGWRDIFSSTPQLWSTIILDLPKSDSNGLLARFTQEWIDRSCSLPVTIWIHCRHIYPTPQLIDSWIPFFDAINRCSGRWECLSLNVPDILLPYFQGDGQTPSRLKELRLYDKGYSNRCHGFFLRNAIPHPEKVTIDTSPLSLIGIRWSHLKHVSIRQIGLSECLALFQLAPDMTYCHILSISSLTTDSPSSSEHIIHRSLKTLLLGNSDHILHILRRLTLPSLEELQAGTFWPKCDENLPAFVKRSSCPLTKLAIGGSSDGMKTLIQLASVPTLTDLTIYTLHLIPNFLQVVASRSIPELDIDEFLPNLRRLALHVLDANLSWSVIPHLFAPQSEDQNCRLKALVIDISCASDAQAQFRSSMNRDLAHKLQDLRRDGFDIRVNHSFTRAPLDLLDRYLEEVDERYD